MNSVATTKGGTHVEYVTNQIIKHIIETANRKKAKQDAVHKSHVKAQLHVFVNALIENPTFDSQTKEALTLQSKKFGATPPELHHPRIARAPRPSPSCLSLTHALPPTQGSTCKLSGSQGEKFLKSVVSSASGIVEAVLNFSK